LLLGLAAGCRGFLASRREERRAAAAELAAAAAREHLAQAKLEVLQAQVHPHFLFNALHAVGGLVREGHDTLALSSLASLSDLLRSSLEHGGDQLVTLADELALVQRYIDIEVIRFADRLDWTVEVEPAAKDAVVPSLILLPLLENAVRYAVEPRASGGRIVLHARRDGDDLVVQLQDDGPGFSASLLGGQASGSDDRRHFGLSSTRERLAMLYGDRGTLSLGNLPEGGAQVIVRMPAQGVEA
jgi:LytS/YehU family sensor histidine kinase